VKLPKAKPKIAAAAPSQCPRELNEAYAFSRKVCEQSGIKAKGNHSEFRPHVTLCRNVSPQGMPIPVIKPNIPVSFTHLHLFESVSGKSGVQYDSRFSFPLPSNLSIREQLKQGLVR
jgi:2'-5' RNA ligase